VLTQAVKARRIVSPENILSGWKAKILKNGHANDRQTGFGSTMTGSLGALTAKQPAKAQNGKLKTCKG